MKIYLHFFISFLAFILLLLIETTDYYLINKQYHPFSMYTNFEIYNFNHREAHTRFADFDQVIIKISHSGDFEQAIIKISHFGEFERAIIKISHFYDFEQEQQ